jgi:Ca2+/Na+ antiporter
MIKMNRLRILIFLFVIAGFLFIVNSSLNTLIGSTISETANFSGSILGALFIIEGLVLFIATRKTKF